MTSTATSLPLAAVGVPVLTAVLVATLRRRPAVRDGVSVLGAIVTFVVIAALTGRVLDGEMPTTVLGEPIPGIELSLRADAMGMLFALLASSLWVLAAPYAIGYLRGAGTRNRTRFAAFYALCLSSAFGLAFAGDLITFYLFYEMLTVATYPLVTHTGDEGSIAAGRSYLVYLLGGGVAVLLAVVIVYTGVGALAFVPGGFVAAALGPTLTAGVFLLFAAGFATKAGLMPVHSWLPAAMIAPTPVSALLHAVAVVKAGVFGLGRIVGFVIGPDALASIGVEVVLQVIAGATVVIASVIALRQDHLKRRLAYSTIAHLALIVLGFSLVQRGAFEGSLLHMVNHGVLKITLFFCAGAIHVAAHKDHVSELDGIGRRMPLTMSAFALAAYGLAALPPMGGFVSKMVLTAGALEAGEVVYAVIVVFSGLFTAGYLFPVVYRAFFRPTPTPSPAPAPSPEPTPSPAPAPQPALAGAGSPPAPEPTPDPDDDPGTDAGGDHEDDHGEASALMVVPLGVTAVLGLVLGLGDPVGVIELASLAAETVTQAAR